MKKELEYFCIENAVGWNQDWFKDKMMYHGGCGAVTACDLCIHLARRKNMHSLYPYDADNVNRKDYIAFSEIMKPYLSPRSHGIDTLELYISGISDYWRCIGADFLKAEGFSGNSAVNMAEKLIREQIDEDMLVPFLLLHHKSPTFKDLEWHWFNLSGYGEFDGEFYVKIVTYGSFRWLSLHQLWDTGHERKGGIIRILNN